MTDKIEGSKYVTLGMVWPIHYDLRLLLEESEDDRIADQENQSILTRSMKAIGRKYMGINKDDFEPQFEHKVMTILDPTMKKLTVFSLQERLDLGDQIEEYLLENYPNGNNSSQTTHVEHVEHDESDSNVSLKKKSFMDKFMSLDGLDCENTEESELTLYLKHRITSKVDIFKWWTDHALVYPRLFQLFLKFSCIPGSSASSERVFSHSGGIISEKRSLLLPENVDNLIVARNAWN